MSSEKHRVAVWDAPLRIFHWALVALIGFAWWSAEQGLGWMEWHMFAGQAVLGLVAFRVLWGLVGTRHARFSDFLRGPRQVVAEVREILRREAPEYAGHGPAGGWAAIVLLLLVTAQAGSGLFASDDIFTEAPLAATVSGQTEAWLNWAHANVFDVLLWVVGIHVAVVVLIFPLLARTNLLTPMITGAKRLEGTAGSAKGFGWKVSLRALVLLGVCLAGVFGVVRWAG
jgi:cytochrome b